MKRHAARIIWLGALLLACLLVVGVIARAAPVDFGLPWGSVDSGGGRSAGGGYTLQGAAGQPDAGLMQGGGFSLAGGFWGGAGMAAPPGRELYLPLIVR